LKSNTNVSDDDREKEKVEKTSDGTPSIPILSPFADGEIAVASSQAAALRSKSNVVNEDWKEEMVEETNDETASIPILFPFPDGDIDAASAQAAALRSKMKVVEEDRIEEKLEEVNVETPSIPILSPFPDGDIALAVAQGAALKSNTNVSDDDREKEKVEKTSDGTPSIPILSPFVGGGIAAASSQATALRSEPIVVDEDRKEEKVDEENDETVSIPILSSYPDGDIAAAAAQAAALKYYTKVVDEDRKEEKLEETIDETPSIPILSTFADGESAAAVAAAQAAALRSTTNVVDEEQEEKDSDETPARPTFSPFACNGIAAAAAQPAAMRLNKISREEKVGETSDRMPSMPILSPFAGGGIAAAAARAAALRSKMKVVDELRREEKMEEENDETCSTPILSSFAGGGIAAAAAQAAALRSNTKVFEEEQKDEDIDETPSRPTMSPFAGGGIAAAAAQAAALRSTMKNKYPLSDKIEFSGKKLQSAFTSQVTDNMAASEGQDDATVSFLTGRHHFDATRNEDRCDSKMKRPGVHYSGVFAFQLSQFVNKKGMGALHEHILLRSLEVANQAVSIGMTGWVEYGSSCSLDRNMDRIFEIMQRLARHYAEDRRLDEAVDILKSLLTRCELSLPLYHPMTLMVSLDLAGAMILSSRMERATQLLKQVSRRFAKYLAEQEEMYFDAVDESSTLPPQDKLILRIRPANDFISMLMSFISRLEELMDRDFSFFLGETSETTLISHCFLADSMTVLANCLSMNEPGQDSVMVWTHALKHYRTAFEGWAKEGRGLSHPSIISAACGLCRCLRELDKLDQAISILSAIASALNTKPTKWELSVCYQESIALPSASFLPPASRSRTNALQNQLRSESELSAARCLWYLAVYSVERNPDERGRIRALSLLHASSESLRRALKNPSIGNEENRLRALEILRCVEVEATALFEPLKAAEDVILSLGEGTNAMDRIARDTTQIRKKLVEKARQAFQGHFVSA